MTRTTKAGVPCSLLNEEWNGLKSERPRKGKGAREITRLLPKGRTRGDLGCCPGGQSGGTTGIRNFWDGAPEWVGRTPDPFQQRDNVRSSLKRVPAGEVRPPRGLTACAPSRTTDFPGKLFRGRSCQGLGANVPSRRTTPVSASTT